MYHYIKLNDPNGNIEEFYQYYYETKLDQCEYHNFNLEKSKSDLEIYITNYNNPLCIEYQIKTLDTFLKDVNYKVVVCDTAGDQHPNASEKSKKLCLDKGWGYIKLPYNIYDEKEYYNPSMKLGVSMNWVYRNCITHTKPFYFGFLDQDCFLIDDIWTPRLKPFLDKNGMYGIVSENVDHPEGWNLHVIYCFYRYNFVSHLDLDFRPYMDKYLDTGGCNYEILYKAYSRETFRQNQRGQFYFSDKDWFWAWHDDDYWLHTMHSSANVVDQSQSDVRTIYMCGLLEGILHSEKKSRQ